MELIGDGESEVDVLYEGRIDARFFLGGGDLGVGGAFFLLASGASGAGLFGLGEVFPLRDPEVPESDIDLGLSELVNVMDG